MKQDNLMKEPKEEMFKKVNEKEVTMTRKSKPSNGNRKIQYLIAYTVSLASISAGAFSTWPAPVMPKFQNNETNIDITPTEMAWMVSMSSPGFMAGSLAVRFVADRFGRRATILSSTAPFATGTIIVAFATQAWLLYITRFLWGFSAGMYITVVTLYLAELADKEIRGSLTIVPRFMFNFGNLLMMCVGPFVSYSTLNYMLLALPVIQFAGAYWVPETPYFYLKEDKVDAARKVLAKIRVYKDGDKTLEDDVKQLKADVRNEMRHSNTIMELFTSRKYRKAVIIAYGLKATQLLTGQLVLSEYLGLIILESGTTLNLTMIFITFGVVRFLTSVMSSALADRVGRRPLLIHSYFGTAICLLVISIYFLFKEALGYDADTLKPYSFIPFAGIIACNVISTLGYYSVIVVVPAEIFPLNIKALAVTCLSIFGGFVNFGMARGYQAMKDVAGLFGVFLFVAIAAVGGSIFSLLYVPETKGKSLREIQEQLQGDLYENDDDFVKSKNAKNVNLENDILEVKELLNSEKRIDIVRKESSVV